MKTFHKPEWYNVSKKSRTNNEILNKYFKKNISYGKEEISTLLGPMYAEYFLPALGNSGSDSIIETCRFKELPQKKISMTLDRAQSDFSMDYDENAIKTSVEEADFLIIDDEEDWKDLWINKFRLEDILND